MDILSKYSDEELQHHLFGVTKTQTYKLRKGMMTLADVSPDLERRLMHHYTMFGTTKAGKPDPNNPDYTHPGFEGYSARFKVVVAEVGLERAYTRWTNSQACGCMGPQNGEPFCPCQMNILTAERYATRTIVPTEEGKALL